MRKNLGTNKHNHDESRDTAMTSLMSQFFLFVYNTTMRQFLCSWQERHKIQFIIMISDNCMEKIQHTARLNTMFGRCQDSVWWFNTVSLATLEIHISSQWRGSVFTVKYCQFILFVIFIYFYFYVTGEQWNYALTLDRKRQCVAPSQSSF